MNFIIQIKLSFILEISSTKTFEWKFMQYSSIENSQMIFHACMNNIGMHG
jgi:hypothetical protein